LFARLLRFDQLDWHPRQIEIRLEHRKRLIIRKGGNVHGLRRKVGLRFCQRVLHYADGATSVHLGCSLDGDRRGRLPGVILQKTRMSFSAMRRFSIEVALHQGAELGFGLGQGHDVRSRVQLALSIAPEYPVLP
jgi:hypothetical protein